MVFSNSSKIIAVMAMISSATAQVATPGLIAGYQARTPVDDYLEKDMVEAALETLIGSESCADLAAGEAFWNNGLPLEGGYLKSIPTYQGSISAEWQEYIDFAGTDQYHVNWVDAAFARGKTNFPSGRGDAEFDKGFGGPGNEGKGTPGGGQCVGYEECVKKVTAFTFSLIESVQLMQKAIDLSESGCVFANGCDGAMEAWDAAVAVYAGSLEGTDGNNSPSGSYGKALYGLGDKRCPNYATCGPNGGIAKEDTATINSKIMSLFAGGQQATYAGITSQMKDAQKEISNKMAVPLIQGTLRYAYKMSNAGGPGTFSVTDKTVGEGAAFAVGVLPKLWACSSKGYEKAYKEMKVGGKKAGKKAINYSAVKNAFECNYQCLGITCAEVGDFFDGSPTEKAFTCDDADNASSPFKVAKCATMSKSRKKKCKKFVGSPGVADTPVADDDTAPVASPVASPVAAPVGAPGAVDDD